MPTYLTPGSGYVRRVARTGFPVFEFAHADEVQAHLGRTGWWRIYFGRGQEIELSNGARLRLRSVGTGGGISPVIVDSERRKVVIASALSGGYGINGEDYAYRLFPDRKLGIIRPDVWHLRRHEEETGVMRRAASTIDVAHEVPVPVVLLAFALADYGIPGERRLGVPAFQWGVR